MSSFGGISLGAAKLPIGRFYVSHEITPIAEFTSPLVVPDDGDDGVATTLENELF